jgi:hypothetical protein
MVGKDADSPLRNTLGIQDATVNRRAGIEKNLDALDIVQSQDRLTLEEGITGRLDADP